MEASVAAPAAGGEAEAAAAEEGAEAQAAALDPSEVMARFDAMQGSMEQMRSQLSAAQQAAPAAEEAAPEEIDLSWLDPTTPEFDPEAFQQNIGQLIQQAGQQAAMPVMQEVAEMKRAQAAAQLRTEFPEIGEPETAQNVLTGATEYAGAVLNDIAPQLRAMGLPDQMIQAIGQGIVSSAATWRAVYLGAKGLGAAKGETPIDEAAALLQGGSGPRPGSQEAPDPAQQIVAARGGSVLPY